MPISVLYKALTVNYSLHAKLSSFNFFRLKAVYYTICTVGRFFKYEDRNCTGKASFKIMEIVKYLI